MEHHVSSAGSLVRQLSVMVAVEYLGAVCNVTIDVMTPSHTIIPRHCYFCITSTSTLQGCSVSLSGQPQGNCAAADGAQLHPEQQANMPSARSTTPVCVPPPVERGAFYARSESSKQILALRSRQVQQLAIFPLQQQAFDYADNHSDLAFRSAWAARARPSAWHYC
jgi:hypothetical protein